MDEVICKRDIENLEGKVEELLDEQRKTRSEIMKEIDKSKSEIIAVVFSQNRKIRQEISYQTMILKTLEDHLSEIQFDEDTGISSKIEVSVGGEIFGTGAKWILDIDTGKASYSEILKAIQLAPGISNKRKKWAKSKIKKLFRQP